MRMDERTDSVLRWALCLFFCFSGGAKLWSLDSFSTTLSASVGLPIDVAVLGGVALCLLEILLGLGLLHSRSVQLAALSLLIMMVCFTLWAGWNYWHGKIEDCGCFGEILPRATDPWLIIENILIGVLLATVMLGHVRSDDSMRQALPLHRSFP
jgi:uncharacterized membrane protein YphA (DoxX/SURF4 family)